MSVGIYVVTMARGGDGAADAATESVGDD